MNCTFSRDTLALYVEGDLPKPLGEATAAHLERCPECHAFSERLRGTQSLLKSMRREAANVSDCAVVRREVMSIVTSRTRLGWAPRIERSFVLAFRRPLYALATCALLGAASATVLANLYPAAAPDASHAAAVFETGNTLRRPHNYRNWVLVNGSAHRVFIDPASYRAFAQTGTFSEGTVMMWESVGRGPERNARAHPGSSLLLASVKDGTRFDGGWGFFDFTAVDGGLAAKAQPNSDSAGCRTCHVDELPVRSFRFAQPSPRAVAQS